MAATNSSDIDPVTSFHKYLTKPEIARKSLDELIQVAQEIRELELHYRDNRIYIEMFIRDMQEQLRSQSDDTSDTVCNPEFVESLKFVER